MGFIGITVENVTVENAGKKRLSSVKSNHTNKITLENDNAGKCDFPASKWLKIKDFYAGNDGPPKGGKERFPAFHFPSGPLG